MPKQKTDELGSLSKSEKVSLIRLFSIVRAAYASVRNLCKASGLSKKKVEQFLQIETSYTKFGPPIRRLGRLQAFSKYINEIWCMDLAYVDKEASQNSVSNIYWLLLIVFAICPSSNNENKISQRHRNFASFQKKVIETTLLKNFGLIKVQNIAEFSKKSCKEKDIEVHSTMSETKAAIAESAIQSLEHIIYRYIGNHGEKFIPNLLIFVSTRNCHVLRSIGKSVRDVKNTALERNTSHNLQIKFLKHRQYLQNILLHTSSKISTKKKKKF